MMLFSHLYLGLPLGLMVKGYHLNIFLAALVSECCLFFQYYLTLHVLFCFQLQKLRKCVCGFEDKEKLQT